MEINLPSGEAVIERINQDLLKIHQEFESIEKTGRVVGLYFHWEIKGQDKSGACLTGFNPTVVKTISLDVDGERTLAKELNNSKPSQLVFTVITPSKENLGLERRIWTYNVVRK